MGRFSRLDRQSLTRQYFLDFTMKLNFGYLNIEGLSSLKHQVCCSLIDAGIFDILILSETWFLKTFNYMSYPYSFVQSQFCVKRINTRQSGDCWSCVPFKLILSFPLFKLRSTEYYSMSMASQFYQFIFHPHFPSMNYEILSNSFNTITFFLAT